MDLIPWLLGTQGLPRPTQEFPGDEALDTILVGPADVAQLLAEHGEDDRRLVELETIGPTSATELAEFDLALCVRELDLRGGLLLDSVA